MNVRLCKVSGPNGWRPNKKGMQLCFQVLQTLTTTAKQPAQPCLTPASSFLAGSTGIHGAAEAASSSNCKFDLM